VPQYPPGLTSCGGRTTMKYQVIARKFRPQIFEEVVGQKPIVRTLQNAIQTDRVGHAYLFSGSRGVGKTTTARILAKGLNCIKGPSTEPCGTCPSCTEIAAAQSMDVLEIDGASNNGVDHIRELRDSTRYAPTRDRYKIFIIDEVHMLSTPAFNALLKVLEEPPPHVVFILATTERHKLPATILSRCQIFTFRSISASEIQAHLRQIADREGAKIDDRGLSYIVKAAEGSMRDAQSLLDLIIAFGGQDIAQDDVRDVLGFIPTDIIDRTSTALAAQDSRDLLECISIVVDQGLSLQQYVRECIGRMRDLLMLKLGMEDKVLGTNEDKIALANESAQFSQQELIRNFDMLLRLENELKWTSQPRFHLEAGMIKLALIGRVRDIEDVIRDLRQGASPAAPPVKQPLPAPAPRPTPPEPQAPPKLHTLSRQAAASAVPATAIPREAVPTREPTPAVAPAPHDPKSQRPETASNLEAAKDEPLVKRFLEVFRGDIAQVKPSKGESQ